jgi:hypothetical protein
MSPGGQRDRPNCAILAPMRSLASTRVAALLLMAALVLSGAPFAHAAAAPAAYVAAGPATYLAAAPALAGRLTVHSMTVEFGPTRDPRLFTVECLDGEHLVSGGYSGVDPSARVIFSYPSDAKGTPTRAGEEPHAWTVGVVNDTKNVLTMRVAAACLVSGGVRSSAQVVTETHGESAFSLAVDCPNGTVRTGGGYSSQWARALGAAAVTGNYPTPDRRWGIDVAMVPGDPDVKPRATVSVYAVCLSGDVEVIDSPSADLNLTSGTPLCTGGSAIFAPTCVIPRSGFQSVGCTAEQTLVGGGYQLTSGALPGANSVIVDAPSDVPSWNIAVRGSTPTAAPISIRVTPMCLLAVVAAVAPVATAGPVARPTDPVTDLASGQWGWPVITGVGAAALLLLLLLALFTLRRATKRRGGPDGQPRRPDTPRQHPLPQAQVDVVVRSRRSAYRVGDFREVQ